MHSSVAHCWLFTMYIFFSSLFFFFNDTATTEIYTLSLHDALPISVPPSLEWRLDRDRRLLVHPLDGGDQVGRSEEHTSELQSHLNLVCRLLLEKKKKVICRASMDKTCIDAHIADGQDTVSCRPYSD